MQIYTKNRNTKLGRENSRWGTKKLEVNDKVVVSQGDRGRQRGIDRSIETHLMAHMGEIGLTGIALGDNLQSLGKTEM